MVGNNVLLIRYCHCFSLFPLFQLWTFPWLPMYWEPWALYVESIDDTTHVRTNQEQVCWSIQVSLGVIIVDFRAYVWH